MWARAALAAISIFFGALVSGPLNSAAIVVVRPSEAVPFIPRCGIREAKAADKLIAEKVNISRLANEEQHIVTLSAKFPFKQRLIQSFIEVEGKFGRDSVGRNNLRAQSACMQGKQVVHRRRHTQRENWAGIIIHQDSGSAANISESELYGLSKPNAANETIPSCFELVSDNDRVQKWGLDSDHTVFGDLCGSFSSQGRPVGDRDRLFHIGRLLVGDSSQGGGFRIEAASFRGQDGSKYNEGQGEGNGANCSQRVDGVPIGSRPISNRDEDAGPIIVYGTLVILTATCSVVVITMRTIKKQESNNRKTEQGGQRAHRSPVLYHSPSPASSRFPDLIASRSKEASDTKGEAAK